jgi:hypothetical protein
MFFWSIISIDTMGKKQGIGGNKDIFSKLYVREGINKNQINSPWCALAQQLEQVCVS